MNFKEGPLLNIKLVRCEKETFRLLWPSHHLLVDGWSSSVIFKDLLIIYQALSTNQTIDLEALPSHKSYLAWKSKKPIQEAELFWSEYLKGLKNIPLFHQNSSAVDVSAPNVKKHNLSKDLTLALTTLAKTYKVTLNTIIQGAWSIVLSRYFGKDDITYGATVSGRSADFPNMELMTGMFVNVQPVRSIIDEELPFANWFNEYQKRQRDANEFQHINIDQITSIINWPSAVTMFDSLLIFENYPKLISGKNNLELSNYKSGITSTYPVTMAITPSEELKIVLSVLPEVVGEVSTNWLLNSFIEILELLSLKKVESFSELKAAIPVFDIPQLLTSKIEVLKDNKILVSPKNDTEERILKIWKTLFGSNTLSVDDNFFEIGGKSLLAVKMFTLINREFKSKLPPTTLLEHGTIEAIGKIISTTDESENVSFKNLVTIQSQGEGEPLFCLHAGGGHVFFYNPLAKYMEAKRPIYALRPSGLFENEKMHQSMEEMAADYVKEILLAQPKGPYHLLVYCFSTAVGFEMANMLNNLGRKVNLIVMDTMAEQEQLTTTRFTMRTLGFIKRFARNPFRVINIMVYDRVRRYIKPTWIKWVGTEEEKNTSKTTRHLVEVYNKYNWKSFKIDISLILTEKPTAMFNEELVNSWEKISNKVNVFHTKGNHRTLFEEPDVPFVAETINECIEQTKV